MKIGMSINRDIENIHQVLLTPKFIVQESLPESLFYDRLKIWGSMRKHTSHKKSIIAIFYVKQRQNTTVYRDLQLKCSLKAWTDSEAFYATNGKAWSSNTWSRKYNINVLFPVCNLLILPSSGSFTRALFAPFQFMEMLKKIPFFPKNFLEVFFLQILYN